MIEFLRKIKFTYALYNFFHKKQLMHNIPIYKKLGINKKYFSPVSSKDFKHFGNNISEEVDNNKIINSSIFKTLNQQSQQSLLNYNANGFAVLSSYFSAQEVDVINTEIDTLLQNKKVGFSYVNKIMFAIHKSALLKNIGEDKQLTELLDVLINGKAKLFQSINFLMGSEQDTHSDSIHMTTHPLGGLLGVWIALDDITTDNGPLHYYVGSHKLPYYLNADYDNEGSYFMLGKNNYDAYEKMIANKIVEHKIEKTNFIAKKGDLLIWHANLFHGGNKHIDKTKSRKSMVLHYFNEEAICYHEVTQRPALMK